MTVSRQEIYDLMLGCGYPKCVAEPGKPASRAIPANPPNSRNFKANR